MMTLVDVTRLSKISLFEGLTPEQLAFVAEHARQRTYKGGEAIVHQEEIGETCYVILHGTVKISTTLPDGKEVFLALLATGDTFGEMSLIDSTGRSADVMTQEETTLLSLDRTTFNHLLSGAAFARNLMRLLARRLRLANARIQTHCTQDVNGRIAFQLLEFANLYGETQPDGSRLIPIRLTQTDIALLVGASRERVNQCMGFYKDKGILSEDRAYRITIHKTADLQKWMQ